MYFGNSGVELSLNVLMVCYSFPSKTNSESGIFIKKRAEALSRKNKIFVINARSWNLKNNLVENFGKISAVSMQYFPFPGDGIAKSHFTRASLAGKLKRFIVQNKIDIVHAYNAGSLSLAVEKICKSIGVPVVLECLGSDLLDFSRENIAKKALIEADSVIVVSNTMKKRALQLDCPLEKITIIPNGVEPNIFRPKSQKLVRKKLGIPLEKKVLLFVGNLLEKKGVIELAECQKKFYEKIDFWFVGEGKERKTLGKFKVKLAGSVSHEKVSDWLNAADIFVLPSHSEGMNCAMLEAMACRKPVIASNIPSNRELIADGKNGLLFECGNKKALSKKIKLLIEKPRFAEKLGKNALETIRAKKLTWEENAKKTRKVYSEMLRLKRIVEICMNSP